MITSNNRFQFGNNDPVNHLSRGEQWLGSLTASVTSQAPNPIPPRRHASSLSMNARSHSLGSPHDGTVFSVSSPVHGGDPLSQTSLPAIPPRSPFHTGLHSTAVPSATCPPHVHPVSNRTNPGMSDPFDAEWAALATRSPNSTNPFLQNSVVKKTFEVHM